MIVSEEELERDVTVLRGKLTKAGVETYKIDTAERLLRAWVGSAAALIRPADHDSMRELFGPRAESLIATDKLNRKLTEKHLIDTARGNY